MPEHRYFIRMQLVLEFTQQSDHSTSLITIVSGDKILFFRKNTICTNDSNHICIAPLHQDHNMAIIYDARKSIHIRETYTYKHSPTYIHTYMIINWLQNAHKFGVVRCSLILSAYFECLQFIL